jgi:hypothetical protein
VLVADVGRRRPLLTRDLPLAALDRQAAYVHDACAACRLRGLLDGAPPSPAAPGAAAPSVLMATAETAAAYLRLAAAADRVVFLDPPLSGPTFAGVLAARAPHADVHLLWGEAEIGFAGKVLEGHYDLDRRLRSLWRTLGRNGGALGLSLDEEMCSGTFLGAAPTLAAALRVLGELGLLVEAGGKNPDGKVDLAASRTYGLWHQRYRNERFFDRCRATTL